MRYLLALLLICGLAPAQKKPQPKPPHFALSETTAKREEGKILLDGKIVNDGERPARGVTIFFDLMDSDKRVIATKKSELEPEVIEPGEDTEFHAQMEEPARVTHVKIRFEDKDGRDVHAANAGPYAID